MSLDINLTGVEKTSNKKTTLTDNSDTFYPSQKAVKTAVDAKENTITAGTTAQYFRGDKTFQTLDKTAVGLSNVDNTSDTNKPVSTATQTALNAKFNTPTGTTAQYLRGDGTVATFPTIPSITGLVPYTGATQDVDLGEYELKAGQVEFDQTPTGTAGVAVMRWNDTDGTIDLGLKGGNVTLQLGQEQLVRVVNKTATNINLLEANYQAVRVTGAQGQRLKVDLAQATTDVLSAETIGLVTETINNNQEGFITTSGLVRGINTTGSLQSETWADGDVVYLSPTTAGRITNIKPSAPNHLVIIGYVVSAHATQGSIFVKVDNGYKLDELHNVAISTPLNNQSLVYETASTLWKNKALTASDVGAVATNSAITGATKTKVTYDAKGLVTAGADATTADIADSSNKRYVTDAQRDAIAVSGTIIVTSGTSFTTPSNITTATKFDIVLVGGGGGGAGTNSGTTTGGGGCSSGVCIISISGLNPSTSYVCAIGSAGAGGASNTAGSDGGNTTLTIGATTYTAEGGEGGKVSQTIVGGGNSINGTLNFIGNGGKPSAIGSTTFVYGAGADTPLGYGSGGLPVGNSSNGQNATNYGAGGGGARGLAVVGGNGSNGIIIAKYYS